MEHLVSPVVKTLVDRAKTNRRYAYVIGAGVALFPIHNKWLTDVTSINGMATAFVPALAAVIWILATLFFLRDNWRDITWGDKRVWFPLLIIVGAITMSGGTAETWDGRLAPMFTGIALLATYLVARTIGKDVFVPLAIGAGIASFGIILYGFFYPGRATGGFVFERNFDIATGYIIMGAILFQNRYQWVLVLLATIALCLSGAPEAVFAIGIIFLVVLLRKDISRRLAVVVGAVAVIIAIGAIVGWLPSLYKYTINTVNNAPMAKYNETQTVSPLEIRWLVIKDAVHNLKPLGDGYNLTVFEVKTVHNIPLIIVQQLGWPGILAGLAWLWITIWCLIRTKWKYAFVAIIVLILFDHYLWTQMAPLWWAVVGVATTSGTKSDLIFRN